jgi:hypothetical protein
MEPLELTPESTTEFSLDKTFIGIFNPRKNLNCEEKGVRNYVTAEIPEWEIKNIPMESFSEYGFTLPNNHLLNTDLDLLNIPDDKWLLCPIQLKDKSDVWDIQIGMSGKCKQRQDVVDGMLLELEEELGFKYNSMDAVLPPLITTHKSSWYDQGRKKEYTYSRSTFKIKLDNLKLIDKSVDKPIITVSDEDDYYRTIACLVYGKLTDIRKVLQIRKVDYSCNKDRIIGMAYVSGKTVKKFMTRTIEIQKAREAKAKEAKESKTQKEIEKNRASSSSGRT